jgi:hypothetical protein
VPAGEISTIEEASWLALREEASWLALCEAASWLAFREEASLLALWRVARCWADGCGHGNREDQE